jgi:anti-anti-sigma factor
MRTSSHQRVTALHVGRHPSRARASCRLVLAPELGATPVLAVTGELCLATLRALETPLDALLEGGATAVVVDLSRATFADVRTLHVLLAARTCLRERGGNLVLVRPPAVVLRLLHASAIADLLAIQPDLAAAARALAQPARRMPRIA